MSMIGVLIGIAIGAGCVLAKEQFVDKKNAENSNEVKRQLVSLSDENEKLRRRYKDAERQIEDLLSENNRLKRTNKSSDNEKDDLEDELEDAKVKIKKLVSQNEDLLRELKQYKDACANYEELIKNLKV